MLKRIFNLHTILEKRILTESTFVLKIERNGLEFVPGQHIQVGPPNGLNTREYSIYSGIEDDFLEILVREISLGKVSPALARLKVGDSVVVNDAVGYFTLNEADIDNSKYLFIASGTGISPFHSLVRSYQSLDYRIIHGVRFTSETYEKDSYAKDRYLACTSRDASGDFHGRVTEYLSENPVSPDTLCYLCGNCDMIHDAFDVLEKQGVSSDRIFTEVYF